MLSNPSGAISDYKLIIKILKKEHSKRTFDQNKLLTEQVISKIKIVKDFNKNFSQLCCQSLNYKKLTKGTVLFQQKQDPNELYVIIRGKVGYFEEIEDENVEGKKIDKKVEEYIRKQGDEQELLTEQLMKIIKKQIRMVGLEEETVGGYEFIRDKIHKVWSVCLEDCDLAVVSKQQLQATISDDQQNKASKLNSLEFLLHLPLFHELTELQIREIYFNSLLKQVRKDQSIYNKNDYAYNFYIVKEGTFGIYKELESNFIEQIDNFNVRSERNQKQSIFQQSEQSLLIQQGKNSFFGQNELLTVEARQHSVACLSPEGGQLVLINRQFFSKLVNNQQANIQYLLLPRINRNSQQLADLEQQAFYQYRVKQSQNQIQVQQSLKQKLSHIGAGKKRHRVQKSCIQINVDPKNHEDSNISQSIPVNLPRIDQKSQFRKVQTDKQNQLSNLIMVNQTSKSYGSKLLRNDFSSRSDQQKQVRQLDYSEIKVEKF